MISSLMYLTNTRKDICFVVNTLSQYMENPKHIHLIKEKHVMRYLNRTLDYGLRFAYSGVIRLHGYTDSDWGGSTQDRKSTLGCCMIMHDLLVQYKENQYCT